MNVCIVLGAGGSAQEIYWHARQSQGIRFQRFVFVDDLTERTSLTLEGVAWPVEKHWRFEQYLRGAAIAGFVAGVGDPRGKEVLVEKALAAGLLPLPTIVHESALIQDPSCILGSGGVIAPRCVLTVGITIGNYVCLNVGVTIGHNAVVEDYVNCAPGVHIGGNARVQRAASLGMGTVIRQQRSIGRYVTTGAQACVVKDILEEGSIVAGVPAKPLKAG